MRVNVRMSGESWAWCWDDLGRLVHYGPETVSGRDGASDRTTAGDSKGYHMISTMVYRTTAGDS